MLTIHMKPYLYIIPWNSSSPAIDANDGAGVGVLYIGSDDNYLYSIFVNGTLRWRYLTGGSISSSPGWFEIFNKMYVFFHKLISLFH